MSKLILPKSLAQAQVDRQAANIAKRVNPRPAPKNKIVVSKEQAEIVKQINAQVARHKFLKGLK